MSDKLVYFFFLGSHPSLSATEVFRVLQTSNLDPQLIAAHKDFLGISTATPIPNALLSRLGGSDRIAQLLHTWQQEPTPEDIINILTPLPPKWKLGLSMVGMAQSPKTFAAQLKKISRKQNSRLAFITPSKGAQLASAQVLFNELHHEPNSELTIIHHENTFYLTHTIQVQDIKAYELRDTSRPARNTKVGMLPPKLAQMMINTAILEKESLAILDPFCGAGTILQEGWLMGHKMIGSDASDTMIGASQTNLQWMHDHFDVSPDTQPELLVHDAQYAFPSEWNETIDAIVTEPYLGKPLSSPLPEKHFKTYVADLHKLYAKFFTHAHKVLKPGGHILFILPAIHLREHPRGDFRLFPTSLIDEIKKSGYRKEQLLPEAIKEYFPTTERDTFLYSRPDAHVAREITLWKKI